VLKEGCRLSIFSDTKRRALNFCAGANPDQSCAEIDTKLADGCSSNATTAPNPSRCDLAGTKTRVQYMAPDDTSTCTATFPVCGDDHTCRGCTAHTDCPCPMSACPRSTARSCNRSIRGFGCVAIRRVARALWCHRRRSRTGEYLPRRCGDARIASGRRHSGFCYDLRR